MYNPNIVLLQETMVTIAKVIELLSFRRIIFAWSFSSVDLNNKLCEVGILLEGESKALWMKFKVLSYYGP